MKIRRVGVDLAKNGIHVHRVGCQEKVGGSDVRNLQIGISPDPCN